MDNSNIQNIFSIKSKWYLHVVYWLFAAALMFFVFSNRNYDLNISSGSFCACSQTLGPEFTGECELENQ